MRIDSLIVEEWLDASAYVTADNDKYQMAIDARIAAMEKRCWSVKIDDVQYRWEIDRLTENTNCTSMCSENFSVGAERYKMRLACGWRFNEGRDVNVFLYIYAGERDDELQWPSERRITMTITNRERPRDHRTITNRCRIEKPANNDYRYSGPFVFGYSDLSDAGLLLGDCMIVKCAIDGE